MLNRPPRSVRIEKAAGAGAGGRVAVVSHETIQQVLETCRRQAQAEIQAEREQVESAATALRAACQELQRQQAELRAEAEQQLLELAVEIAGKVVMQEIQAGRYEIEPIIRAALAQAGPAGGEVEVHLNGDDLACLKDRLGGTEESLREGFAGLRLVADGTVGRAECVVRTGEGVVESRIQTHLREIDQALKES